MTKDEAIKWLIKPVVTSTEIGEIKAKELKAYNMAIEALLADAEQTQTEKCEECIHHGTHKDKMTCKECVSAEAAQGDGRNNIKRYPNCQMRTSLGNCDAIGGFCTSINAPICDAFHKLSEAVQGEWILDEDADDVKCSVCGHLALLRVAIGDVGLQEYSNYCPNCGARMKGGDSE